MVPYVDPSSGHAYQQSPCQEILFEARASMPVDLFGHISEAVAMDAAQRAPALNQELNQI